MAEAFTQERITASHANLIARLPQESQAEAYEQCWRKDWQEKEAHLLPAKSLSAWIQVNLYLSLADAPFDREDPTLNPAAGACVICPRRSGYNTSLFADVQEDQCLDGPCYKTKVTAHIDRELAAQPELVQIENGWRRATEQRPGAVQRGNFREIEAVAENPDAEPVSACAAAKPAIIVYGKRVGTTLTVCTDNNCPVHDPRAAARQAQDPAPTMSPPPEQETEEEAEKRKQQYEQQQCEYREMQERRTEEPPRPSPLATVPTRVQRIGGDSAGCQASPTASRSTADRTDSSLSYGSSITRASSIRSQKLHQEDHAHVRGPGAGAGGTTAASVFFSPKGTEVSARA